MGKRSTTARAVADWLLARGEIAPEKLAKGNEIAEGAGLPLPRALLFMRLVEPASLANALAAVLGKRLVNLDDLVLPPVPDTLVNEALCRELRVLPLGFEPGDQGERLVVAMADPSDQSAGSKVAGLVGKDVRPLLVNDDALSRAIQRRFESDPTLPPKEPTLVLIDLASVELDVTTDPGLAAAGPRSEEGGVFSERPVEATARMKRPRGTRLGEGENDTIRAPRPPELEGFDEAIHTSVTSTFKDLRVCFVAAEAAVRSYVERELSPLLGKLFVAESLERALELVEERPIDDVVLHAPKNDAPTGLLMDRLSRVCDDGIVVLSDDASFSQMPCVRVRMPRPAEKAALPAAILDGLFSAVRSG